jgi:hypothetical protein
MTAVEWLNNEIESISLQVFDGFLTFNEFMEQREQLFKQAKEMEEKQAHQYAEFAIRCDREELKVLNFKDFIKL